MKANEVRAFDVSNNDGDIRHGFVIFAPSTPGKDWLAFSLGGNEAYMVGWYPTPNEAIAAIMANEDQRLVDKDNKNEN